MTLDQLYAKYGELMVQKELLDSRISIVKSEIAKSLNQSKVDSKETKSE